MIKIRKGQLADLENLLNQDWAWNNNQKIQDDYIVALKEGNREFLAVEDEEKVIGELWLFWDDKEDQEQANGKDRAYLSTLRLHPDYRRQGIGTTLINKAFELIKDKGFKEVTIGSYKHEPEIQTLYKKWGFTERIKEGVDTSDGSEREYILFLKRL
jgi:ribosomal protein S18 acetylase RimI-like enzyme